MAARRFTPKVKQAVWSRVVEDAIWRVPPFEHSEDSKHEKGFRDRVVLESVLQSCSILTNETVFLSEDGLLKTAILSRNLKNLLIVPRLEDFTSRVRLLKEKAETEWVEAFFAEATRAFYAKDKLDCLYSKEKIHERIAERFEDLQPPPAEPLLSILEPQTWEKQTEERITLGTTQFEKRDGERILWKTDVMSAAAFSGKAFLDTLQEKIRISTFAVNWTSQANLEGEVKDTKFESVALKTREMISDNNENRTKWALPAKPVPQLPTLPFLGDYLKNLPSTTAK